MSDVIIDVNVQNGADLNVSVDTAPKGPPGDPGVGIESVTQVVKGTGSNAENVAEISLTDGRKERFVVRNGETGAPGEPGATGVGIASMKQTTIGLGSGAENVFEFTLTDGKRESFSVHNGIDGKPGAQGDPGKAGFSPSVNVSETADFLTIETTNENNSSTITVANPTKAFNTATEAKNAASAAMDKAEEANARIDSFHKDKNLAKDTSETVIGTADASNGGTGGYTVADLYWRDKDVRIDAAKQYTLSYDYEFDWSGCASAMPTSLAGISVNIFAGTGSNFVTNIISKDADYFTYGNGYDKGRFVITFNGSSDAANPCFAFRALRSYGPDITGLKLTISNFMLEEGDSASEWVPALGDEPRYNLLGSVTLTEAVNEVLFDGLGSLKTGFLEITTEAGASDHAGYIQLRVSKSVTGVSAQISNLRRTSKRYTRYFFEIGNGFIKFFAVAPSAEYNTGSTCAALGVFRMDKKIGCVRTYLSNSELFPAGSKFELWGVKE